MKRFLILFMVFGLIVGSVATADAGKKAAEMQRTVKATYVGAQLVYEYKSCVHSGRLGCVIIPTRKGEDSLTASVTDSHGQAVAVSVVDARSDRVYGTFCGNTTQPIRFHTGNKLELWVGGKWLPTWWPPYPEAPRCLPGMATKGAIRVTFSG